MSSNKTTRNDAYIILTVISLMAVIASCVLLWHDMKRFPSIVPDANPPALGVR